MGYLGKTFADQLLDQREYIALANVRGHVVLRKNGIPHFADRARLLNHLPDDRADWIEAVVDTAFEIEDDRFSIEIAGDLILAGNDDRLGRQ